MLFLLKKVEVKKFELNRTIGFSSLKCKKFVQKNALWRMKLHVKYFQHTLAACVQAPVVEVLSHSPSVEVYIMINSDSESYLTWLQTFLMTETWYAMLLPKN